MTPPHADAAEPDRAPSPERPGDEATAALADRIGRYVADPDIDDFDDLARAAFAVQYERVEPFRRLCNSRGVRPAPSVPWRRIPPVPVAAFKAMALHAAPPREVFRSSGTTQGQRRSVH
ncbi:MAG: hypothetical protein AAFY88_24935, partial [Acidobacteriota bacterium]